MKRKSFLAVAIVLTSILSFAPAMPAFAVAGYVTLNQFSGPPGTEITVSGGGWENGDTIMIYAGSTSNPPLGSAEISDGQFETEVIVPGNAPEGPLAILAVNSLNEQATNSFYVVPLQPSIEVESVVSVPHEEVRVHGMGFLPNEEIELRLENSTSVTNSDPNGSFSDATLIIPNVPSGVYLVHATGQESNAHAIYYFWINQFYPSATPSAWYAEPGDLLSFTGSGFAPHETVSVVSNGNNEIESFTTNNWGSFSNSGELRVPLTLRNTVAIFTLTGETSAAQTEVMVAIGDLYPYAYPSSYYLLPGDEVTFTGGGFGPDETINVFRNGSNDMLSTIDADEKGEFSDEGGTPIPFGEGLVITYNLVGSESGVSASTMVSVGAFYPSISPSAYYSAPGGLIDLLGSGFARNEGVAIRVGGNSVADTDADKNGNISVQNLQLPFAGGTTISISAVGTMSSTPATVGVTLGQFYPTIEPTTYYAFPGNIVHINGTGFAAQENIEVKIGNVTLDSIQADNEGEFENLDIRLPWDASGSVTLTLIGENSNSPASITITIGALEAELEPSQYYAETGQEIEVRGVRFGNGEEVRIESPAHTETVIADETGTTPYIAILVPYTTSGSFTIYATGLETGIEKSVVIGVGALHPSIVANAYYVQPGSNVVFSGSGFAAGEQITAEIRGTEYEFSANSNGMFEEIIEMPRNGSNATIEFRSITTSANISITISLAEFYSAIWFDNYYAVGGTPFTIFGAGFAGNEDVTLNARGDVFATATTDQDGSFAFESAIPFSPAGQLTIGAIGDDSGASAESNLTVAEIYTDLQLGSYAGAPGSSVQFLGNGYLANEPIMVTTDRTGSNIVHEFSVGQNGSFNDSNYSVPNTFEEGNLTFTVEGGYSFTVKNIVYYVTGI